jgi:hypothetical protein
MSQLLVLSLLTVLSCSPAPADGGAKTPLVGFYQHGCRGYCPSYQLTIYHDGSVDYEGLRYVQTAGKATVRLTAAELKRVKAAVKRANLWKYPEQIESRVADAPTATLTAFRGQRKHAVTGSIDRPKALLALEDTIKDVVEAHGIALRQGVDPNAPPATGIAYLSVLLRPDVNAGNWLGRVEELRLRLVRRLGEENRWVVSYDPKEISEASLIRQLRELDGALEVKAYHE